MRMYSATLSDDYTLVCKKSDDGYALTVHCTTHRSFVVLVRLVISRLCTRSHSYSDCVRRIFEGIGIDE